MNERLTVDGVSARVTITAPMAGNDTEPTFTLELLTAPGMTTGARIPLTTARRLRRELSAALEEAEYHTSNTDHHTKWLASLPVNPGV